MAGMFEEDGEKMREKLARKSPAVRLKLSVSENEDQPPQEVVIKVTKTHEVVEVKDFIFKRKRRIPLGESANVPASTKKAKTQQEVQDRPGDEEDDSAQGIEMTAEEANEGDQGGVQVAPNETAVAAAQPPPPVDVVEAAQAALASLPQGFKTEGDRLLALCEKLVEDEMRSAEGQPGAELLQKALDRFLVDIRASLGNGTLQCTEETLAATAVLERQQKLRSELETQNAILSARLQRFQKEEEEWNELLQGSSSVNDNAAADMAPAMDLATAAAPVEPPVGAAEPAAAMDRTVVSNEEGTGSGAAVPALQNVPVEKAVGILQQAQADTHRTLTMQVEGLCAMVEGVRELVDTAEHITSAEFDKLYKEKFSALPGLNSPARLIREIVRPPRSRLQAASLSTANAGEASPATPVP
ncbi:g2669 [Coccomyxa elongata]